MLHLLWITLRGLLFALEFPFSALCESFLVFLLVANCIQSVPFPSLLGQLLSLLYHISLALEGG